MIDKKNFVAIIVIMLVGIVSTIMIAFSMQPGNPDGVNYIPKRVLDLQTGELGIPEAEAASEECNPRLEEVQSKIPFELLTPTVLPSNYALRSAGFLTEDSVLLKFSDQNTCGGNLSLKNGAIYLAAGLLDESSAATNGVDYTTKEHKRLTAAGISDTQIFNLDSTPTRYAVGYPAGVGESIIINEKNEVLLTENYDYPADLWVVDDSNGTIYRITAFMPLEDLVAIAESLE